MFRPWKKHLVGNLVKNISESLSPDVPTGSSSDQHLSLPGEGEEAVWEHLPLGLGGDSAGTERAWMYLSHPTGFRAFCRISFLFQPILQSSSAWDFPGMHCQGPVSGWEEAEAFSRILWGSSPLVSRAHLLSRGIGNGSLITEGSPPGRHQA